MIYWYEQVLIGLMTWGFLYYIKWELLDGADIFISLLRYLREQK